MQIISDPEALRVRLAGEVSVGFVPTMGNLHAGHIDLVRIAREHSRCVVVSIFVNRLQFGPHEDFDRYPRTFKDDCDKCEAAGVDVIFAPDESSMYPQPQTYTVDPSDIQTILEGAVRPGHFRGVATVVMKLFNIVRPTCAVFGKKDYQQCRVLTNMVSQFNLPIEMILANTVRAPDGLALSSRNGYLSDTERKEAPALYRELLKIAESLRSAKLDRGLQLGSLETEAMNSLANRGWQPDYVSIRRASDLLPPAPEDRELVIVAAAKLGPTRLIDNLEVSL